MKLGECVIVHVLSPGTRYVVVDCGGGTVDITAHELLEGSRLKELQRASGGAHGSIGNAASIGC